MPRREGFQVSEERTHSGRRALVTGAGQGVGRAVAHELARLGAEVVVNDFSADRADCVTAEIRAAGGLAASAVFDVTDKLEEHLWAVLGDQDQSTGHAVSKAAVRGCQRKTDQAARITGKVCRNTRAVSSFDPGENSVRIGVVVEHPQVFRPVLVSFRHWGGG